MALLESIGALRRELRDECCESTRLPLLAPPEVVETHKEPGSNPLVQFTNGSAHNESTDFSERMESHDPVAQLTVYAMTGSVLFILFPVGFALLIFNILGGENIRTTSHVLALSGMAIALGVPSTGLASALL